MPTYEYRCPEGHDFEDFVLKISDTKPELPCPACGRVAVKRMSAGSGLLFKGSGFYITDYGKDGKKDQRAASKSNEGSSTAGGGASSSSTPAPSTGSAPSGSSAPAAGASAPKSGPAT